MSKDERHEFRCGISIHGKQIYRRMIAKKKQPLSVTHPAVNCLIASGIRQVPASLRNGRYRQDTVAGPEGH